MYHNRRIRSRLIVLSFSVETFVLGSIATTYAVEVFYLAKQQIFLINQGYSYKVIAELVNKQDNLFFQTRKDQ
ncbi:unnamed protein product [Rotaria sp. Silwood1]|nr:unnamed protein product [Rotaria sp. Silwood1]CAF3402366.1 unnamed protein product [Rotaria sp. Silwood1]CAF4932625.1 unnamed protein product [Rotaria sp. Silwood1]